MAGRLMPCGGCNRHVRSAERSCPFCGAALALLEPLEELRLLTALDRRTLVALGAVLSAAGIALGCREAPRAVYGAPSSPIESPGAAASGEPPAAVPLAPSAPEVVPEPSHAPAPAPPSASAKPTPTAKPAPSAKPAPTAKPASGPTGAPAAAYGAPPSMRGPGIEPSQP